jgi:hypothetical protein
MAVTKSTSLCTGLLAAGVLAAGLACAAMADDKPGQNGHGNHPGRDWRRPEIVIEPSFLLTRPPRPDVNAPHFIMSEIRACAISGTILFVDCLRANHGSIMIRKLEACLGSEVIPPDVTDVEPCLPVPDHP